MRRDCNRRLPGGESAGASSAPRVANADAVTVVGSRSPPCRGIRPGCAPRGTGRQEWSRRDRPRGNYTCWTSSPYPTGTRARPRRVPRIPTCPPWAGSLANPRPGGPHLGATAQTPAPRRTSSFGNTAGSGIVASSTKTGMTGTRFLKAVAISRTTKSSCPDRAAVSQFGPTTASLHF